MTSNCPPLHVDEDVNTCSSICANQDAAQSSLLFGEAFANRPEMDSEFSIQKNPYLYPRNLLRCETERQRLRILQEEVTLSPAPRSDSECVDGNPIWWLAHSKPRQEKKLAEQLARLGIAHYLPVQEHKALTRGRTRVSLLPRFPGYMFLCCDTGHRHRALETNRLVALHEVCDGQELCSRLFELADLIERGAQLTVESLLVPGRRFRVKTGLFKDKEGTVIKRGGKTRLFVYVSEILGGVSMEIEDHLLEPI